MGTRIEVKNNEGKWAQAGPVLPAGNALDFSNETADGTQYFRAVCSDDDSMTAIYSIPPATVVEFGPFRMHEVSPNSLVLLKELRRGDEPYPLTIKPITSPAPREIQISHV